MNSMNMKVIAKLEITENRPEEMRVIKKGDWYLVQTLSVSLDRWISQKEYKNEQPALADCLTWY